MQETEKTNVRVRFAPSPTGPLHIGGVRTALYNYLFAKKTGGTFILRVEDTDQNRYVEGAEDYIKSSLEWLGLNPDEGPGYGGALGPYRQSERKDLYAQYALELVDKGHAYYAFDTPEELSKMREDQEALGHHSAKYDIRTRTLMRNSLTLSEEESQKLIEQGDNVIIRLKMPENVDVRFTDKVREEVKFNTDQLDDKVILKADGMPTYHLANIVDDHLMNITHVIRGEEWLSSTAHHVLMYQFLGWKPPVFTHLPLILKPSGKGKLSKRDGAKFGFPVFPMEWDAGDEIYHGFKEDGYDSNALINFLVLLGWNPGNDEEIMSLERMTDLFSLEKIVKSGARFDFEKANWFNQQYIMSTEDQDLLDNLKPFISDEIINNNSEEYLLQVVRLMKERLQKFTDFNDAAALFFEAPDEYDAKQVRKRFSEELVPHFDAMKLLIESSSFASEDLSTKIKGYLNDNGLKMGTYLPLLRIMMCGSLTGPDLFDIIALLGKEETVKRWDKALQAFTGLQA